MRIKKFLAAIMLVALGAILTLSVAGMGWSIGKVEASRGPLALGDVAGIWGDMAPKSSIKLDLLSDGTCAYRNMNVIRPFHVSGKCFTEGDLVVMDATDFATDSLRDRERLTQYRFEVIRYDADHLTVRRDDGAIIRFGRYKS